MMKVLFFTLASGRAPVLEFIRELELRPRAETFRTLELIESKGLDAANVSFRHIQDKVWEIRGRSGAEVRIFYVIRAERGLKSKEAMILLHGYLKKTAKAPKKEIEIAVQRAKEVM